MDTLLSTHLWITCYLLFCSPSCFCYQFMRFSAHSRKSWTRGGELGLWGTKLSVSVCLSVSLSFSLSSPLSVYLSVSVFLFPWLIGSILWPLSLELIPALENPEWQPGSLYSGECTQTQSCSQREKQTQTQIVLPWLMNTPDGNTLSSPLWTCWDF